MRSERPSGDRMKCEKTSRRKDPDAITKLRLFASSAGFCQQPECREPLFVVAGEEELHVGEMAHIIAASDDGPRGDSSMDEDALAQYENLILLCPRCHTTIDKAPDAFPNDVVRAWKTNQDALLARVFGFIELPDRSATRMAIDPLLDANRVIWEEYGPDTDERFNPESELPAVWRRKLLGTVFPNNRRVLGVLDANRNHLDAEERRTLEMLRQHIDDIEARHLGGHAGGGRKFPSQMEEILR